MRKCDVLLGFHLFICVFLAIQCSFALSTTQRIFSHPWNDDLQLNNIEGTNSNPKSKSGVPTHSSTRENLNVEDLTQSWKPPLSTRGRYIVDADGYRFRIKGGNWHGASGTYLGRGDINDPTTHHSGEQAFQTPLCLDRTPIEDIVQSFLNLGINTVRLPFSNEMIYSMEIPPDLAVRANPQFRGMKPLEIFDNCIAALTKRGIAVILNNHTTKNMWCCGPDINSRWNSAQSEEQWQHDWIFMVKRYKHNPRVIGAELYNEVRRDLFKDPTWGDGGDADWWLASQNAGSKILREANPDILIIIEGINYVGVPTPYTTHWRPELQPVRALSHTLPVLNKLVYSAHFYSYTGPNATGGPQFGTHDVLYRDLNLRELENTIKNLALYVATPLTQEQYHYTNPVLISEFGSGGRNDYLQTDREWWSHFTSLLIKYDTDFTIWPLVGWHENAKGDLWAFNAWDSMGRLLSVLQPGDWRLPSFLKLINAKGKTGKVEEVLQKRMLSNAAGSMQMSNHLHLQSSVEQNGEVKLSCPDGLRLSAISHHQYHHALCTDALYGSQLWEESSKAVDIVTIPMRRGNRSWWSRYTKLECGREHYLIGFSLRNMTLLSVACARSPSHQVSASPRPSSRTVWLKQTGRSRENTSVLQDSWKPIGAKAATCQDHEVMTGVIVSESEQWSPAAILCQHFITPREKMSKIRLRLGSILRPVLWTLASTLPIHYVHF